MLQIENLAEPLAFLVGMLGLVWHQNRGTNRLRDEIQKAREEARQDNRDLRDEIQKAREGTEQAREEARQDNRDLRYEFHEARKDTQQAIKDLQSAVLEVVQRLSRIEGFLGIGISGAATHNAAGAAKAAELRSREAAQPRPG